MFQSLPVVVGFVFIGIAFSDLSIVETVCASLMVIFLTAMFTLTSFLGSITMANLGKDGVKELEKVLAGVRIILYLSLPIVSMLAMYSLLFYYYPLYGDLVLEALRGIFGKMLISRWVIQWPGVLLTIVISVWLLLKASRRWVNEKLNYGFEYQPLRRIVISVLILALFNFTAYSLWKSHWLTHFSGNELSEAFDQHFHEKVDVLMVTPKKFDKENRFGVTPLMSSLMTKHCKSYLKLKNAGFGEYGRVKGTRSHWDGHNILGVAILSGCFEALEELLTEFDKNSIVASHKRKGLHVAAISCQPEAADRLLQNGADPNISDEWGNTPLFYSAQKNCLGVAYILKEGGADFEIQNKDGRKAIELLHEKSSISLKYFFKKYTRAPTSL